MSKLKVTYVVVVDGKDVYTGEDAKEARAAYDRLLAENKINESIKLNVTRTLANAYRGMVIDRKPRGPRTKRDAIKAVNKKAAKA